MLRVILNVSFIFNRIQEDPPRGWSFEPTEVLLNVDGRTDACSQGKDINFTFKGFGITGRVNYQFRIHQIQNTQGE